MTVKITPKTIVEEIIATINGLDKGLKDYGIRDMVKHAEELGPYLKQQRLETNQIRKFLDAINQIKALLTKQDEDEILLKELNLIQIKADKEKEQEKEKEKNNEKLLDKIKNIQNKADLKKGELLFNKVEADVVLLKPKLAYAAARQKAAIPFKEVMVVAIDKVYSTKDFERLVQFIESIIAYHKEAEQKKYRR
jgi:CRISPR-associated protein Csm2